MTDRRIIYIASLVTASLSEEYDLSYYSHAGTNKKRNVVASLNEVGYVVTVVAPMLFSNNTFQYYRSRTVVDEETGVTVHAPATIDIYGLNYIFLVFSTTVLVIRLLLENRYDSIIFYNFRAENAIPAMVGGYLFQPPIVLESEDGVFLHDNLVVRWGAKVLRYLCGPFIDGAFCANQPLAARAPTDNTVVLRGIPSIGQPVDLPNPGDNSDETIVMFAGRFDHVRGIDTFLSVTQEINTADVTFWISGYGSDKHVNRVRDKVESLDDPRLSFFGTLPWEEYRQRLIDADILVNFQDPTHPISEYTYPSKLLDFMSAEKIILSTDMSDLADNFNGMIRFPESAESLPEALDRTIQEHRKGTIDDHGKRARAWIDTNCTSEKMGRNIRDVLIQAYQNAEDE